MVKEKNGTKMDTSLGKGGGRDSLSVQELGGKQCVGFSRELVMIGEPPE